MSRDAKQYELSPARRAEMIQNIYERGQKLRFIRRFLQIGLATAILIVLGLGVLFVQPTGNAVQVALKQIQPSLLVGHLTHGGGAGAASSPGDSVTLQPLPSPTVCRNSNVPACGSFRWDPPPERNEPMTITISVNPETPKSGEEVTIKLVVEDPDAKIASQCPRIDVPNDATSATTNGRKGFATDCVVSPTCPSDFFGPWTPPAKSPGHYEVTYGLTFERTGRHVLTFSFASGSGFDPICGDPNPYSSKAEAQVEFSVGS